MKKILGLVLFAAVVTLTSCDGGFTETESGLKYQFHVENADSAKPAEGDMLMLKMRISTEETDSVIFDSEEMVKREGIPYFEPLVKPTFAGDYSEALAMMHVGDSMTVKVNADTFFKHVFKIDSLPDFVESGSDIIIGLKLIRFMPLEQFKKYITAEMDKLDKPHREKEQKDIANYLNANGLAGTPTETGLYYFETKKGTGDIIKVGQLAHVHYKGMYLNGETFDSSEGREPYAVPVGMRMVIAGWDEALQKMQSGTKATIIVPYRLAYGTRPYQTIPAYSTLVFNMEVTKVEEMPKRQDMPMPQGQ